MEQMPMKVPVVLARELGSCYAVRDAQQRSTFAVLAMVSSSSNSRRSCACRYERRHLCWQQLLMMCCLRTSTHADSPAEVPEGDWFCWFCAKERKLPYQHAKTAVSNRLPAGPVTAASCIAASASAMVSAYELIIPGLVGYRDATHQGKVPAVLFVQCISGLCCSCTCMYSNAQLHASCCLSYTSAAVCSSAVS
jgi:hypothetical protein